MAEPQEASLSVSEQSGRGRSKGGKGAFRKVMRQILDGISVPENIFGDCMYKEDVLYFELRILRDVRLLYSDRQFAGELSKVMNECRVITELTGYCSRCLAPRCKASGQ